MKLGIVLSGGGAKGAYEVGFLKALSEFKLPLSALAGTSIGALNGAVFCANLRYSQKEASEILEQLWLEMAKKKALKFDVKKALINGIDLASELIAKKNASKSEKLALVLNKTLGSKEGFFKTDDLIELLTSYAPYEEILKALPFYLALTKSDNNFSDTLKFLELKNEQVAYLKVQNMSREEAYKAILASAALPLAFDAVQIQGEFYRDGCLGSTENDLGNIPALPLVEKEKCTDLIICYLNDKSSFDKEQEEFRKINIIEVFPKKGLFTSVKDYVNFDAARIKSLIKEGYEDSKKVLSQNFRKNLF